VSVKAHKKPWRETPLHESSALSRAAGCRVFLKLENLQPSGSFKSRGIGHYMHRRLLEHPSPHTAHFYCSSGGNAGLACIHASKVFKRPCTIVVPTATSAGIIAKMRASGASKVIQYGANWKAADTFMHEAVMKGDDAIYVPPFDHPDIWAGHETMVEEIIDELYGEKPDAIICSVGGGGLLCGLIQGLDKRGWGHDIDILAMETIGADSLNTSIRKGEHITLPEITSLATTLGCVRVCDEAWEYAQRPNVHSIVLEDAEAAMGCWRLADDERLMVEMSCGVDVALCYDGRLKNALGKKLTKDSKVVVVLCGGSNVTVDLLNEYRRNFGYIEQK
ncbi:tryptophan synthase beta subunit-like PLP-dependent enzyme, partial [Patellaria atrata CBS 101060]